MKKLFLCPLCRQKNFQILFKKERRQIVKCLDEGLVFVNPRPSEKAIAAFYDPLYFQNLDPYFKNRQVHLRYFRKKLDQIEKRIRKKGKILDIGCGLGFFLQEAKKRGWRTIGIDVSDYALDFCRKLGLKVKKGAIKEVKSPSFALFKVKTPLNFRNNSFRVVVSLQTIEHETDPMGFLEEIYRILKPGGLVVLTTPNYDSWTRKLMGSYWFGYRHKEHLFFLTPRTLKTMLEKAGFKKIEIKRDNPRMFTLGYYLTRLTGFYPTKFVKTLTGVIKRIIDGLPVLTDPLGDILVFASK